METDARLVEKVRAAVGEAIDLDIGDEDVQTALSLLAPRKLGGQNRNLVRAAFPDDRDTMLSRRTAVAAMAAVVAALSGRKVHVASTREIISELEAAALGRAFASLGLSLGCLLRTVSFRYDPVIAADTGAYAGLYACARESAFAADAVYGSFYEFGFNRLQIMLRASAGAEARWLGCDCPLDLMIVEDVDAFVADVSPIAITGQGPDRVAEVSRIDAAVAALSPRQGAAGGDFEVFRDDAGEPLDARWLDRGVEALAERLGFLSGADVDLDTRRLASAALLARNVYIRGRDYIVADGDVHPRTRDGRIWMGRRLNGGLHNAIEAKEGLRVQREGADLVRMAPNSYLDLYASVAGLIA